MLLSIQPMKDGVLDDSAVPQMLDDDALEQRQGHATIPDALRIHDHDWPASANAKARRLSALDASRAEKQPLTLEERWQRAIECAPPSTRRAEAADTYDDVTGVRLHDWKW